MKPRKVRRKEPGKEPEKKPSGGWTAKFMAEGKRPGKRRTTEIKRKEVAAGWLQIFDRANVRLTPKTPVEAIGKEYRESLILGSRKRAIEQAERIAGTREMKGLAEEAFERWDAHFGIIRAREEFTRYRHFLEASEMLNPKEMEVYGKIIALGNKVKERELKRGMPLEVAEQNAKKKRLGLLNRLKEQGKISQETHTRLVPGAILTGVESRVYLYPEDVKRRMVDRLKESFARFEARKIFSRASVMKSARQAFADAITEYRDRHDISLTRPLEEEEIKFAVDRVRRKVEAWKKDMFGWERSFNVKGVEGLQGPKKKVRDLLALEVENYVKLMQENPSLKEMKEKDDALRPLGGYKPYRQLQIFIRKYWPEAPAGRNLMEMGFLEVMLRGMKEPFGVKPKTKVIEIPERPSTQELEIRLGRTEAGRELLKKLKAKRYERAGKPEK